MTFSRFYNSCTSCLSSAGSYAAAGATYVCKKTASAISSACSYTLTGTHYTLIGARYLIQYANEYIVLPSAVTFLGIGFGARNMMGTKGTPEFFSQQKDYQNPTVDAVSYAILVTTSLFVMLTRGPDFYEYYRDLVNKLLYCDLVNWVLGTPSARPASLTPPVPTTPMAAEEKETAPPSCARGFIAELVSNVFKFFCICQMVSTTIVTFSGSMRLSAALFGSSNLRFSLTSLIVSIMNYWVFNLKRNAFKNADILRNLIRAGIYGIDKWAAFKTVAYCFLSLLSSPFLNFFSAKNGIKDFPKLQDWIKDKSLNIVSQFFAVAGFLASLVMMLPSSYRAVKKVTIPVPRDISLFLKKITCGIFQRPWVLLATLIFLLGCSDNFGSMCFTDMSILKSFPEIFQGVSQLNPGVIFFAILCGFSSAFMTFNFVTRNAIVKLLPKAYVREMEENLSQAGRIKELCNHEGTTTYYEPVWRGREVKEGYVDMKDEQNEAMQIAIQTLKEEEHIANKPLSEEHHRILEEALKMAKEEDTLIDVDLNDQTSPPNPYSALPSFARSGLNHFRRSSIELGQNETRVPLRSAVFSPG